MVPYMEEIEDRYNIASSDIIFFLLQIPKKKDIGIFWLRLWLLFNPYMVTFCSISSKRTL